MNRLTYLVLFLMTSFMVSNSAFGAPKLSWDPSAGDVKGYKVHYGETSGSYTKQMDVGNSAECTLSDLTLNDNRKYFFSVTAYNDAGESDYSNEVSWASGDSTPPITPQGFSGNAEPGQAVLQWQLNSDDDLNGYYVYCGESSRAYGPPIPVGKTTICTVPNLEEGKLYYFAVSAYDTSGNESGFSNELAKTIPTASNQTPPPTEPPPGNPNNSAPVQYLEQWMDTQKNNSMDEDDTLFTTFDINGIEVFGTNSTQSNIHSHYVGPGSEDLSNYECTGRMMISSPSGGIGVTILSQYPNSDAYYRLRRYGGNAFHISPHGTKVSGDTDSGVVPSANTWYRFKLRATDTGTRTEIRAKVWKDGSAEPSNWQIDAYDGNASRLTQGTLGVWAYSNGSKYWDEIVVPGDGVQEPQPEEDNTPPTISITAPVDNYITKGSQIALSGSAADDMGVTKISWTNSTGGSGTITGASIWEIPNILLREGENLITVKAIDASSKEGSDTVRITSAPLDTIAPTIVIASPTNQPRYETKDKTIIIAGSASDNKAVQKVTWNSSSGSQGTANGTTDWRISDLQLQEGDNLIQINAMDDSGNSGSGKITITYSKEATQPPSTITAVDPSQNSENWLDTAANNSMNENDNLFKIMDLSGNNVFGTTSTQTNIHSHYTASGNNELKDYVYTGKMMITASSGGIGVTFFSQYPNSDTYYRLRRYGSESFRIDPHGVKVSGDTDTGVRPIPDTWYRYRVQVTDTGNRTEIKANVWKQGTAEPSDWQVDAYDSNANRLKQGTFGVWSYSSGNKYWGDISVMPLK